MPVHQSEEKDVERRVGVNQQIRRLTRVKAAAAGQQHELVDERLAEAKESFDGVGQRSAEPGRLGTVSGRVMLSAPKRGGGLGAFGVEVRQQVRDELGAALAEPAALVDGQIFEPPLRRRGSGRRPRPPIRPSDVVGGRRQRWPPQSAGGHHRLHGGDQETAVTTRGGK